MYGRAQCIGQWLHRYFIHRENDQWVEEVCEICGKQQIYTFADGRIDNQKYAENNARLFLQPGTPQYTREYAK